MHEDWSRTATPHAPSGDYAPTPYIVDIASYFCFPFWSIGQVVILDPTSFGATSAHGRPAASGLLGLRLLLAGPWVVPLAASTFCSIFYI